MGIQVILYKANTLCERIIFFDWLLQKQRIVDGGVSCSHLHKTPAAPRVEREQHAARAMTRLCVIWTVRATRFHGKRNEYITKELTWPFIKANDRGQWVVRLLVKRENIFHVP